MTATYQVTFRNRVVTVTGWRAVEALRARWGHGLSQSYVDRFFQVDQVS